MTLKISEGNSKMGAIRSVSLPSLLTCRCDCECNKKCYARKIERLRPAVKNAYSNNYELLISDPDTYWREVEASIMMSRFFRYHVSGDIPDKTYFIKMTEIASRNSHCEMLCFTKKYDIINECINDGITIPKNLHIIFSGWRNLEMVNPYNLPEAHVLYNDGTTTARDTAIVCGGNCTECAKTDTGCWILKSGEQILFKEH